MIQSVERTEINKLEDIDPDFLLKYETWQQFAGHQFPASGSYFRKFYKKITSKHINIIIMN